MISPGVSGVDSSMASSVLVGPKFDVTARLAPSTVDVTDIAVAPDATATQLTPTAALSTARIASLSAVASGSVPSEM
jgi:hypothetical protein